MPRRPRRTATPTLNPDWLTRHQAAAHMQVVPETIDRWAKQGKIVSRKVGRIVRISAASLDKILPGSCA